MEGAGETKPWDGKLHRRIIGSRYAVNPMLDGCLLLLALAGYHQLRRRLQRGHVKMTSDIIHHVESLIQSALIDARRSTRDGTPRLLMAERPVPILVQHNLRTLRTVSLQYRHGIPVFEHLAFWRRESLVPKARSQIVWVHRPVLLLDFSFVLAAIFQLLTLFIQLILALFSLLLLACR